MLPFQSRRERYHVRQEERFFFYAKIREDFRTKWVELTHLIEGIGNGIDVAGALIIVIGAIVSTGNFLRQWRQPEARANAYPTYRQSFGKAILLGLEFLVAGDIIRTVAVSPTLEHVAELMGIVFIRTFLSTTLQLEVNGRWPWEREPTSSPACKTSTPPE